MVVSTPSEPFEFTCHVGWLAGADWPPDFGAVAAGLWRGGQAEANLVAVGPLYVTPFQQAGRWWNVPCADSAI
jgi:hypothetical protein